MGRHPLAPVRREPAAWRRCTAAAQLHDRRGDEARCEQRDGDCGPLAEEVEECQHAARRLQRLERHVAMRLGQLKQQAEARLLRLCLGATRRRAVVQRV